MKKVFMSAIFIAATAMAANAQTGSVLVGGNVDFSSTKYNGPNDNKNNVLTINPLVGYQFTKNLTAGATAELFSQKTEDQLTVNKNTSYAVGPFIRYTQPLSNTFSVFGQVQGLFGGNKNKSTTANITTTTKGTNLDIDFYPAIFVNVKNGFGLNFNIGGLSYNSSKPSGGNTTNVFDVNFGKTVGIGVSKNFGGTRKS